jgi:UDP-glucuronate decarboxylase
VLIETEKPDVYNVGNPEPELDMATLAQLFSEISKSNEGFELVKYPSSYPEDEPNRRCPNINKISTELGYKPKVNLNNKINNLKPKLSLRLTNLYKKIC